MRRTLLRYLLPAAVALMMSAGIVMMTAAQTGPPTEGDPVQALVQALVPGWTDLDRLVEIGVLPTKARDALVHPVRVRLEQAERGAPGLLCRRVANSEDAPASLVSRCREAYRDGPALTPEVACRRVAAATDPADALIERCRAWLASQGADGPAGLSVCRRIADADVADAALIERCRTILAEVSPTRPSERPHGPEWPGRPTREGR